MSLGDSTTIASEVLVDDQKASMPSTEAECRQNTYAQIIAAIPDAIALIDRDYVYLEANPAYVRLSGLDAKQILGHRVAEVVGESFFESLRAMKADERTRTIPVVMVTSSREDSDIKMAFALGANSYVVKPVSSDEFAEVMSNLGSYWLCVNESLQ